jgi:protein-S-isoprenylcysteine O-methyltransferase Ste14
LGTDLEVRLGKRRVSDWIGFVGHFAVAIVTAVRTPSLTVFVLPSIIHLLFAAGSFLVRDRPQRVERKLAGRIISYAGGFGMFVFLQYASMFKPEWLAVTSHAMIGLTGILVGVTGVCIEIWAIWHLKFAFSTEPAARRLITTGPYRWARHPIYSGSCVAYLGLIMTRPTLPIAIGLVGWAICMWLRMRYEEAMLMSVFPTAYAEYRRQVGAILPRLSSKRTALPDHRAAA